MRLNLIFSALMWLSLNAFAVSEQYEVSNFSPVYVKLVLKNQKSSSVKVYVSDKVTGKKALIELSAGAKSGEYEGLFLLVFNKEKKAEIQLTRVQKNAKPFLILPQVDKKSRQLVLFESEKEAVEYAKATNTTTPMKVEDKQAFIRMNERVQEQERLSIEEAEAKRREDLLRKQEELSRNEKRDRALKAMALIRQADEFYAKGQYKESSSNYGKAIELDPSLDDVYYKYGVSLYKTDDFNKSLAILSMGEGGVQNRTEYDYYVGLNHMKLKEYEKALENFNSVRDDNDPNISVMAAFFAGNIEFQRQKYPEAKTNFEYVLDNSKDPRLDDEAEKMIDEIDRIEAYIASRKDIFKYSFYTGLSYDGNILNVTQKNTAIDMAGYRTSYGATGYYKIYTTYKSELGVQALYADIYSTDANFKASNAIQAADPLQTMISVPYSQNFETKDRSYQLTVAPSMTTLTMDPDGGGRKRMIDSQTLDTAVSFPINSVWSSQYRLQYNSDKYLLTPASDADDQSGTRLTYGMTQTRLMDQKATKTLGVDLGYIDNASKGANNISKKTAVALIYGFPTFYDTQSNLRLDYGATGYPSGETVRNDTTTSLTYSNSKAFKKTWSLAFSAQYAKNSSNVETFVYDKWVVSTMLVYNGSITKD